MKIAVAAMGNTVAGHFGHCENFIFFDTADGAITAVNSVPNPGHRPGFLPNFLADHGAQAAWAAALWISSMNAAWRSSSAYRAMPQPQWSPI